MEWSRQVVPTSATIALHQRIIRLVERSLSQAIPFSEWMELALYHPDWGYYPREQTKLGKEGDFFTNAHVGDLWGRILARKLVRDYTLPVTIVEVGAGDGRLVQALLEELVRQQVESTQIRVYLLERSSYHRQVQQTRLQQSKYPIYWVEMLDEIPRDQTIFLYANELLDAFPVTRIRRYQGLLQEEFVQVESDKLTECYLPFENKELPLFFNKWLDHLPEGKILEVPFAAWKWWQELLAWFPMGELIFIDYGITWRELMAREFRGNTLRGYQAHQLVPIDLNRPGEQDITTHVWWDPFIESLTDQQFTQTELQSQTSYLLREGLLELAVPTTGDPFGEEDKQNRRIQQLLYGMGESFQVLSVRK
ncbi:SAM-dependent methyltransferase [Risungbinella massiliensis]|uniref:SAM-dependent methyltransferase n=1 Tax=Risungbinella massiliensis TaxID=1329796 RepID=UPI0005CBDC5D|nr:SAM-dependent methyltransferase [Risungbinella massiliensis]